MLLARQGGRLEGVELLPAGALRSLHHRVGLGHARWDGEQADAQPAAGELEGAHELAAVIHLHALELEGQGGYQAVEEPLGVSAAGPLERLGVQPPQRRIHRRELEPRLTKQRVLVQRVDLHQLPGPAGLHAAAFAQRVGAPGRLTPTHAG